MANKYCNLIGANKIKDEFTKLNDGFSGVETDIFQLQDYLNYMPIDGGDFDANEPGPSFDGGIF